MQKPEETLEQKVKQGKVKISDDFNLWDWVHVFGFIVFVVSLLGLLGRYWWLFDLFSHFRLQYFIIGVVLAVSILFQRKKKYGWYYLVICLINAYFLSPFFIGRSTSEHIGESPYLATLINVNSSTGDPASVQKYITDISPDLFVLEEFSNSWDAAFKSLHNLYPYRHVIPRNDNFGLAIFSKFELKDIQTHYFGEVQIPTVTGYINLNEKNLFFIATHPVPPISSSYAQWRNHQLVKLPELVPENTPTLLLGDLNITPWNHRFKSLLESSDIHNSMTGWGLQTTWPSFAPYIGIPIDHILISSHIYVINRTIGRNVQSDHLPVTIEFLIKSQ